MDRMTIFIIKKINFVVMSTTIQLYALIVIGLIIFSACAVFSYTFAKKLDAPDLTDEERSKQEVNYFFSKIGSTIGFLIALIPSVKILQKGLYK